mgnify:CR=1 FL=1
MKLGLVFSGGGIRGLSHIGALTCLIKYGLKPQMISGCSAGSIIAGLYAAGIAPKDMEMLALKNIAHIIDLDYKGIFKAIGNLIANKNAEGTLSGFIKGDRIEKTIDDILNGKKMYEADIFLAIPAVDINRGRAVMFVSRKVPQENEKALYIDGIKISEAIRASISIPVIFCPKKFGDYSLELVDGGLKDNLPFEIIMRMGADKILCYDLGYNGQLKKGIDNIFEIASQSLSIFSYTITSLKKEKYGIDDLNSFRKRNLRHAGNKKEILILNPGIYDASILETKRAPEMVERGYEFTKKYANDILEFIYG